jgi:hypothetical protein
MHDEDENPLDKSVRIVVEHKEFISKAHVASLMNVFPLEYLREFMPASDGTVSKAQASLANQLQRMLRVQENLMNTALASDDPDLKRKALSGGKDLFNLFAKFERLIDRQARQAMIESSVKEAFSDLKQPELEQKFIGLLQEKLRVAAKMQ